MGGKLTYLYLNGCCLKSQIFSLLDGILVPTQIWNSCTCLETIHYICIWNYPLTTASLMARIIYRNVSFQALYDQPKVASLDDVLILNDNFEEAIHIHPPVPPLKDIPNKMNAVFTFLLCLQGKIEVSLNFRDYTLQANDVIISRSGAIGALNSMSEDTRFILLVISDQFYFPKLISGHTSELQHLIVTHPLCHLSDQVSQTTLHIYHMLKEQLQAKERSLYIHEISRGLVEAFVFNVLSSLVQEAKNVVQVHRKITRNQEIYERFMDTVEKNFMRERDIKFYAEKLCLTPKYLSQIIYKESGSHAGDHIQRFVILEAKALIKSKCYTMAKICEILHFTSQSFFTKYFKRATGMSPTEYQNLKFRI